MKKLSLNKETIRNLSDESLEQVAGGKKKGGGHTALVGGCVSHANKSCVGCSIGCDSAICDSVAICQSVVC